MSVAVSVGGFVVEDALPVGASGDGEVAGACSCGGCRCADCGGSGAGRRLSVGEKAQGAGDAVEEGVCGGSRTEFFDIVGHHGIVFEAQDAPCAAVETFFRCEGRGR